MTALIIIGLCVIPVVWNVFFVYVGFKQEYKGYDTTVEDFVDYWDREILTPMLFIPVFSLIWMLITIIWVVIYPIRLLTSYWFEKIKHKKI